MNAATACLSPKYKNLKLKQNQSPIELKEKMRKNYKDKVQNCRNLLINRFRGTIVETELKNTLSEIYKSMFRFPDEHSLLDDEENEVLEEIKNELVQEELEWWMLEHEKSQMENIDWTLMEQDDNIICLICQKTNLCLQNGTVHCPHCKLSINTEKCLQEIKRDITTGMEKHNAVCSKDIQFTVVPDLNEIHIFIICDSCLEMRLVV